MVELILIIVVIYLLYLLITKIIWPLLYHGTILASKGSVILVALIILSAFLSGIYIAIRNYILAFLNEINFRNWDWRKDDEPAKRSYFFGPGFIQLKNTIKRAFRLSALSRQNIDKVATRIVSKGGFLGLILSILALIYKAVAYTVIFVIGTLFSLIFALIHGTITTVFMIVCYIIFTIVWLIDRIYLKVKKITSVCPNCKEKFLIPTFECPECGRKHKKLVPGPYGIFFHKCECGRKLPSTFMTGRSKINSLCPICGSSLAASDARQLVFQLVGGSNAGKTVFLSAFYHEFFEQCKKVPDINITIPDEYYQFFQELEEWYGGMECPATYKMNSQMYPIIVTGEKGKLGTKRQFSVFDIAGEMFDGSTADSEMNQKQFHYCDGLLFLIDPFSSSMFRDEVIKSGDELENYSELPSEDVVTNFINYLIKTGNKKANSRCDIPINVIITKGDAKEIKGRVGPAKLKNILKKNPDLYENIQQVRDERCRQFLYDIGMSAAIDNLEIQFTNIHYFVVSAMGHTPDGSEYVPWGVVESVESLIPSTDKALAELIGLPSDRSNYKGGN